MSAYVVRSFYSDGVTVRMERHFLDKNLHRVGLPAVIQYSPTGKVIYVVYYEYGQVHRLHGPARIAFFENGLPMYESYFYRGERFRIGGRPTAVEYEQNGNVLGCY